MRKSSLKWKIDLSFCDDLSCLPGHSEKHPVVPGVLSLDRGMVLLSEVSGHTGRVTVCRAVMRADGLFADAALAASA